jgi:lysosomal Pro-X carboxypeptidase
VSNIAFPNGLLDPWSAYGYSATDNPGIVPITIPNGAHHVDLMFSHPDDTPDIKEARATILSHVHQWVMQACPKCQVAPSW